MGNQIKRHAAGSPSNGATVIPALRGLAPWAERTEIYCNCSALSVASESTKPFDLKIGFRITTWLFSQGGRAKKMFLPLNWLRATRQRLIQLAARHLESTEARKYCPARAAQWGSCSVVFGG